MWENKGLNKEEKKGQLFMERAPGNWSERL
jgi:hypothetical protein